MVRVKKLILYRIGDVFYDVIGVQTFKNSTSSFFPIYIVLNELPLIDRFKPQNTDENCFEHQKKIQMSTSLVSCKMSTEKREK